MGHMVAASTRLRVTQTSLTAVEMLAAAQTQVRPAGMLAGYTAALAALHAKVSRELSYPFGIFHNNLSVR